ncbi:MAG: hypothetical protein HYX68_25455 [Planctomycetes bacterium]|nr:hypothetical protein [Planctomycetota bacterium]
MRQPFSENANYRSEIRAILRLHRLWLAGKGESAEADALRDATDGHWELLSEFERKRIRGLSEDLNSLESQLPDQAATEISAQACRKLPESYAARQLGEWDRALEILRMCENAAPLALISYLRGSIWLEAGDPEVASVFIEHATRLEPDSSSYRALVLSTPTTPEQPIGANIT